MKIELVWENTLFHLILNTFTNIYIFQFKNVIFKRSSTKVNFKYLMSLDELKNFKHGITVKGKGNWTSEYDICILKFLSAIFGEILLS